VPGHYPALDLVANWLSPWPFTLGFRAGGRDPSGSTDPGPSGELVRTEFVRFLTDYLDVIGGKKRALSFPRNTAYLHSNFKSNSHCYRLKSKERGLH